MGTQIYRKPPRFIAGHATLLGFFALALLSIVCNYLWMQRENRKRDAVAAQNTQEQARPELDEKALEELYDFHPDFRYIL